MFTCLVAALVAVPAFQAPATAPVTVESFVPANAAFVARVSSLDDLARIVRAFTPGASDTDAGFDPLSFVKDMANAEAKWDLLDRTRPILIAMSGEPGGPPIQPTLAFTCRDAAAFTADPSWKSSGFESAVSGAVVALSQGHAPKVASSASPLVAGLDKADIVARVDLVQVRAAFGEMIDGALDQMEASAAEAASGAPGAEDVAVEMIDGIRDFVNSTTTFELSFSQRGEESRFAVSLGRKEAQSAASAPRVDPATLSALARAIDADMAMVGVSSIDMSAFIGWYAKILETAAASVPEALRGSLQSMMASSQELYAAMGPAMAFGMTFDAQGMQMSFGVRPKEPATFIAKYVDLLKKMGAMMQVTGPTAATVDGVAVQRILVKVDAREMAKAAGDESGMDAAQDESMQAMFDKMFGVDGMRLTFLERDGCVFVCIGADPAVSALVARLKHDKPAPNIQRALAASAELSPGFAYSIDFARFFTGMLGFLQTVGLPGGAQPPDEFMQAMRDIRPILATGGLSGNAWTFALTFDGPKLVRAAMAGVQDKLALALPSKAKADILAIEHALDEYALANGGKFPDTLEVLVTPDVNGETFLGLRALPVDPWKRAYLYERPAPRTDARPRVYTLGADGKPGGEGPDADIDGASIRAEDR